MANKNNNIKKPPVKRKAPAKKPPVKRKAPAKSKSIKVLTDKRCGLCTLQKKIIRGEDSLHNNVRIVDSQSKEGQRIKSKFKKDLVGYPTFVCGSGKGESLCRVGVQGKNALDGLIKQEKIKKKSAPKKKSDNKKK